MKNILSFICLAILGICTSFAQNANNDPQVSINNYKHSNKAEKAANLDDRQKLTVEKVSLRSQRTNKASAKNCIIVPADKTVATNVQGKKSKSNYKNQFN